ncbi:preprotein translocase subunit SecA [Actinoplanes couchii]|uniref:Protein translocase subunit SecA n=2 Tax=Actinoplanes couchii TaxID=403638 RepID=A0ABQ3XBL3_9ACTN|nr:preprotein translocase subunit SecA [Actinoplanes couchii]GID55864.1 protein translocase subunit SecA [Actinoplanes couchii]
MVRRLKAIADAVNSIEDDYVDLTDDELRECTQQFKERYEEGESLDDLLPEAFAVAREGAKRVLGQRAYDVQLMGGAALHFGNIPEMKTGEGKTLTGVFPAYLNALSGKGVHIITVNDYLAQRDAEWVGRVHGFLGLSVGVILPNRPAAEHRAAYECDITYGTNNEFGFDYLRDNMAWSKTELVQRGHNFAIVDEVDSILIDEARTPLIISGPAEHSARWYGEFAQIVNRLQPGKDGDGDYEVDVAKRTVAITERGVGKVEDRIGIDNLYESVNTPLVGYLNNAIKAKELYKRDKDYIVSPENEVLIVDEFTGRILHGRRYNEGMHQAIEAKEGVEVKQENQTLATVTLQNFFRLYDKLGGMTGTAQTEAGEFSSVYKVGVVSIPTHRPMIRVDHPDVIYKTERAKFNAVIEDIAERHATGQPVLVGTVSVENSEILSQLLRRRGIPHSVLNAKYHAQEATIIAQAGRKGAVTVATNMAGRGTDILLGGNAEFTAAAELHQRGLDPAESPEEYAKALEEILPQVKEATSVEAADVQAAGGLYVLGTERHDSRRIDNQLRGRSGRQGDPGESRFYLSLQDDLMKRFRAGAVEAVMERFNIPEDVPIESKMVSKQIRNAQTQIEAQNAEIRKNVLKYDEVMNKQRTVVYAERKRVLDGEDMHEQVTHMIDDVIAEIVTAATTEGYAEDWDLEQLWTNLRRLYPVSVTIEDVVEASDGEKGTIDAEFLSKRLVEDAQAAYKAREEELGSEAVRELERQVLLAVIDRKWREHLYEMDYLQEGISLRAYAQRDPVVEYQREGFDMFNQMMEGIKEEAVGFVFNLEVQVEEAPSVTVDPSQAFALPKVDPSGASSDTGPDVVPDDDVQPDRVEVHAKGLGGPGRPQNLQYTAPTIDGEAGAGAPQIRQEPPATPPVQIGPGGSPVPASPAHTTAGSRPRHAADQSESNGPSRNAPCYCGSGRKYKRCHGAPGNA